MGSKMMGTALAALALTIGSTAAAQSAAPLSLAGSPAAVRAGDSSELRGPGLWIAGAVVLGLAIWGLTELLDNERAFPTSP